MPWNPDPELETEQVVRTGPEPEPHYSEFTGEKRLCIPTDFIRKTRETALNSFEKEIPTGVQITLRV